MVLFSKFFVPLAVAGLALGQNDLASKVNLFIGTTSKGVAR